jgi:hypothetical protein
VPCASPVLRDAIRPYSRDPERHDDGDHDNIAVILVDLVNDDIRVFDEFARTRFQARTSHSGKSENFQKLDLVKNPRYKIFSGTPVILSNPIKDSPNISQRFIVENNPHAPKSRNRLRASVNGM